MCKNNKCKKRKSIDYLVFYPVYQTNLIQDVKINNTHTTFIYLLFMHNRYYIGKVFCRRLERGVFKYWNRKTDY